MKNAVGTRKCLHVHGYRWQNSYCLTATKCQVVLKESVAAPS